MIKDEMNLALSVDTTDMKTTIDASLLPDEDILPYTVGYIPWEMIQESTLFAWKYGRIKYNYPDKEGGFYPVPNPFDDDSALVADRGIPFCYACSSSLQNVELHAIQRNVNGTFSPCGTSYMMSNQNYTSNKNLISYANLSNLLPDQYIGDVHKLTFIMSLAIIDPNDNTKYLSDTLATGNGYFYVDDYNYITGNFSNFTYTIGITQQYGGGTVSFSFTPEKFATIDETGRPYVEDININGYTLRIFVWCVGMCFYTTIGGQYAVNGFTISNIRYRYTTTIGDYSINQKYVTMSASPMMPQYGSVHSTAPTGFFHGYYAGSETYNCYINTSNELIENEVTLNDNDQLADIQNGLRFKNPLQYGIMFKSFNATDAKIMSLISTPIHRDADGDLWCPEFNDSYELTGNWIPYADQTIDPDINEFDPADIPIPEPPEPSGDEDDGDDIDFRVIDSLPGVAGFVTQYSLTAAQIGKLGSLLWSYFTDQDYWQNFMFTLTTSGSINISDIMSYFISCKVYPFPLANYSTGVGSSMFIGRGVKGLDFDSTLHVVNDLCITIDAGTCYIPPYFGDFRDYVNTTISLYLPYCGTAELNPGDVIGATLSCNYMVDLSTGACTAYVQASREHRFPVACLTGNIGADYPLTGSNAGQITARFAGDAINFASLLGNTFLSNMSVGTRFAGNVLGMNAREKDAMANAQNSGGTPVSHSNVNMVGMITGAMEAITGSIRNTFNTGMDVGKQITHDMGRSAIEIPMLSAGRGFSSFGAPQTAYVQIRRGIYAEGDKTINSGFTHSHGLTTAKTMKIGECKGLTTCANVDISGLTGVSADETSKIKTIMESGFYV